MTLTSVSLRLGVFESNSRKVCYLRWASSATVR